MPWAIAEPDKLSPAARARLEDPRTDLLVSAVSAWEVVTKYRLGKLPGVDTIVAKHAEHMLTLGARELPVTTVHALAAGLVAVEHRDPFDRMLAAQALAEGLPMITADPAMALFPGLERRW